MKKSIAILFSTLLFLSFLYPSGEMSNWSTGGNSTGTLPPRQENPSEGSGGSENPADPEEPADPGNPEDPVDPEAEGEPETTDDQEAQNADADDDDTSEIGISGGDSESYEEAEANAALSEEQIAELVELDAERAKLQAALDAELQRNQSLTGSEEALSKEESDERIKALQEQIDSKKSQMSEVIGDPVYVATGQYYDFVIDASLRYLIDSFDISRTYTSDTDYEGCFGKNWISSLDSRLIFGISPITESVCISFYNKEIIPLENALSNLIGVYTAEFDRKGSNWSEIAPEIRNTLLKIEAINADLLAQEENMAIVREKNAGSFYAAKVYFLSLKISDLLEESEKLLSDYSEYAELCDKYEALISEYSTSLQIKKQNYDMYSARLRKNDEIDVINQNALLPGTKDYYRTAGLETITFVDDSGVPWSFSSTAPSAMQGAPFSVSGTMWTAADSTDFDVITKTRDGYTLSYRNGCCRSFSESGQLVSCSDAHGNWIYFERDSTGTITEITTSSGTVYIPTYEDNHITSIIRKGTAAPLVQYGYDTGRICSVTDGQGDTMFYTWNGGTVTDMTKADGSSISFSYNAMNSENRLLATESRNEEDYTEHYVYDFARKTTEHTDHAGVKTLYRYDDSYRILQIIHSDGLTVSYGYDENGNLTSENRNGSTTFFFYDSAGRKTRAQYPDGTFESWIYDERGNVVSYTGKDNITLDFVRNNEGDLLLCKANGTLLFSNTYTPSGLCSSKTVYSNPPVTYAYSYDNHGNLIKSVSENKTEEWEWDELDNPISYKVNGQTLLSFKTEGHISTITACNGLIIKTITNARKDVVSVEETDTFTGERRLSEYEHDRRHLTTAYYKGDGNARTLVGRFRHDGEGKLEAAISYRNGAAVIEYYDYVSENGTLISSPVSVICFSLSPETVAEYDLKSKEGFAGADIRKLSELAENRRILFPEPEAKMTGYTADSFYEDTKTESMISYSYSKDRRHLTVSEGGLYFTEYELNAWEEPVSKTDGNGNTTIWRYDFFGNAVSSTDPYGNTTEYSHDESGLLTEITYPDGSWQHFHYDAADNLIAVTDMKGVILEQSFDAKGNLIRKSGRTLVETRYTYDDRNRLSGVYEDGTLVQHYEYAGKNLSTDTAKAAPAGIVTDKAGNITEVHDEDSWFTYEYDAGNRLVCQKNLITGYKVTYKYDRAGNRTELFDGSRIIVYEYGANNELIRISEQKDGLITSSVSFDYDCLGRETIRRFGNGVSQTTFYDEAGNVQLMVQRDSAGHLLWGEGFLHDENGRISAVIRSDMSLSLMSYDSRGRLTVTLEADEASLSDSKSETAYLSPEVYYGLQSLLDRMQMTLGNALSVIQAVRRTEYEYDAVSNRISEKTAERTVTYEYDAENRLIRSGDTMYMYDDDGNLVEESSPLKAVRNTYSEDDRLLSSHITDILNMTESLISYGYDALGRRISEVHQMLDEDGKYDVTECLNYEYDGFSFDITGVFQ